MSERKPPLARDLSSVRPGHARQDGEGPARPAGDARAAAEPPAPEEGADELLRLQARVATLTDALEDVVALALSGADYKERAIMMHRRAVAALSGVTVTPPAAAPPVGPE